MQEVRDFMVGWYNHLCMMSFRVPYFYFLLCLVELSRADRGVVSVEGAH
jgi:hypothetical protein